jgi:hypothetical protein
VFSVGGCPWRLSLYPKGNAAIKGSRDHIAVYLEAADAGSAPVGWRRFVEFKLAVVNKVLVGPPSFSPSATQRFSLVPKTCPPSPRRLACLPPSIFLVYARCFVPCWRRTAADSRRVSRRVLAHPNASARRSLAVVPTPPPPLRSRDIHTPHLSKPSKTSPLQLHSFHTQRLN